MKSILIKSNERNENTNSRVKNLVVMNYKEFEEDLIKALINNQIQYVKVDNEFHFLDKIYRLYDFEQVRKELFSIKFQETKTTVKDIVDATRGINIDLLLAEEKNHLEAVDGSVQTSSVSALDMFGKGKAPVYTKSMMKNDNRRNCTRLNRGRR